jgi:hypothetical protein
MEKHFARRPRCKERYPKGEIEAIENGHKDIEEAMLESLSAVLKVPQDQLI